MLNTIKKMISEQKAFQEAVGLIMENDELDDSIILDEKPEEPAPPAKDPELDNDEEDPKSDQDSDNDNDNNDENNEDNEEEPMPLPGNDQLPNTFSKATGEPLRFSGIPGDGDDDSLLNIELDLATNTQTDVLPTPPSNAGDAIGDSDDIMNQHVDSGFGGESNDTNLDNNDDDLMNSSISDSDGDSDIGESEDNDLLSEAISLGTEPADTTTDPAADTTGTDDASITPDDTQAAEPAADNPVTAAVKDKVEELSSDDSASGTGDSGNVKEALLKKLGSITKSLEDAKKAVMDTIS